MESCQNCNETITGNFCANCGQKTSVHRYSFKHFIVHDLIHGFWHVDNGFFFTIKELYTRPGHSIREFIKGKRVGYFSFVTLLVIILGVSHFVGVYSPVKLSDLMPESSKKTMNVIEEFSNNYPKITLLLTIPFYSVFSFFWFRKSKLNLTEHFVLNSYKTVGESIIGLSFTIITVIYTSQKGLMTIYSFVMFCSIVYSFWYYKQFFSAYGYSKKSLLIRSFGVIFSYMILSMVLGMVMAIMKIG
jgi:hypothetical protein